MGEQGLYCCQTVHEYGAGSFSILTFASVSEVESDDVILAFTEVIFEKSTDLYYWFHLLYQF